MTTEPRPRPPFSAWPRHWYDPEYGFAWVVVGPTSAVITQTIGEQVSVPGILAINDLLDTLLSIGFLEKYPGAVAIHDARSLRSIAPGVREAWIRRSERRGRMEGFAGSYIATSATGMTRMALRTASLAVQLATGQPPIRVIGDPGVALAVHNIAVPSRADYERLGVHVIGESALSSRSSS